MLLNLLTTHHIYHYIHEEMALTHNALLLLIIVFIMLVIWFPSRSPAQIVFAICAGMTLLINNGDIPVIEKLLSVKPPLVLMPSPNTPIPTLPQNPIPTLPQNPIREDFVNLILAIQKQENAEYLDQDFLIAIASAESNWNPNALSDDNAGGLFQLIPATAIRFGVKDRFDPIQSIQGGIRYLKWLYGRFNGDYRLIAAGYNAGEGAVEKYNGIPPYNETQIYVSRVIGKTAGFKTLRNDWTMRLNCKAFDCLHLKSQEAIQGGKSNHALYALAAWVQSNVKGFIYNTGFNDQYHQDKYCQKVKIVRHCVGLAVDFTVVNGTDIQATLLSIKNFMSPFKGFSVKALSECNGCTGPHFHAQFNTEANANSFLKSAIDDRFWIKQGVSAI